MSSFRPKHSSDHYLPGTRRQGWAVMVLLAVLITFVCSRASSMLSYPEFAVLDAWMRARPHRAVSQDIVLVGIEASDAEAFRLAKQRQRDDSCTCMLIRRDVLARALTLIKDAGAKVVGIDIVFELPCRSEHDHPLMDALERPGDTVIMSGTNPTPGRFNFVQMRKLLDLKHPVAASPVLYSPRGVIRAVRLIQRDAADLRGVAGEVEIGGNAPPPFALACYAAYRGQPEEIPEEISYDLVRCVDVTIPVWHSERVFLLGPLRSEEADASSMHSMLINWAGPPGTYPTYSLRSLLDAPPENRRRALAGKIVLVGDMTDRQCTPLSQYRSGDRPPPQPAAFPFVDQATEQNVTGLEVHANALDTVLQRRFVRVPPLGLMWALMAGLSLAVLAAFRYRGGLPALAWSAALVAAVFLLARWLLTYDLWLFAVTPAMLVAISAVSGALIAFARAREEAGELARVIVERDNVTATLVHDLKQPLTAINALAQVLRAEQIKGGGRLTPEVIERIQRQVQMALGDIDELLTVDPNRTLHLDKKRFDLAALARDLAIPQSVKTGIHTVEVDAPEEGLWVVGDPRYLGRALTNLMDNATKYWPAGGTVVVEIRREPGQVTTRVIDHGIGVPREAQERLFNRFERAVPSNLDIPGTGIGLFSVRRIMEAHRGTVELISAPGEGSIFILNLPDEPAVSEPMEGLSLP